MSDIDFISKPDAIERINFYARNATPFVFIIDFKAENCIVQSINKVDPDVLKYTFGEISNTVDVPSSNILLKFEKDPVSFGIFKKAFDQAMAEILYGNSFLLNLTFETPVNINLNLLEIYQCAQAKYKIWLKDSFVCFSPETFIKIKKGKIYSYPMKGTIDASILNAKKIILSDKKEKAEHYTIVDLIRNDLNMVSQKVKLNKFRYIDCLKTNFGDILQVSSEIVGTLPPDYLLNLGEIIFKLLPAGSISGAPKEKTLQIIHNVESHNRGFYSGICGYFDGKNLDTGVMIRFIEQREKSYYFKSGGGITHLSSAEAEYQEMIKKIYVPFP